MRQSENGERLSIDVVLKKTNLALRASYRLTPMSPDKINRSTKDIDGLAVCDSHPDLAIEHTLLESIEDQEKHSAWLTEALSPLIDDMKNTVPNGCALEIDYDNVRPGQDWQAVRSALKTWLVDQLANLRTGRIECDASEIPFFVALHYTPELDIPLYLVRRTPPGDMKSHLLKCMNRALGHKYERLGEYRADGATTILILQSHDSALISSATVYESFLDSTERKPRPFLDQVWFIHGERAEFRQCCFRGPPEILAAVNPENARFGPQFEAEWRGGRT